MSDSYNDIEGVNWSTLKALRDSPLHYRYTLEHGREDTPQLALGRVTHALIFEPETFARDYAVYEDGDRRGKAWEAFTAEPEGRTIFKPSEIDDAVAMAEAVRRHPLAEPYLDGGRFEQVLTWKDQPTGIDCKCKADWIVPRRRLLVDLKTTQSIDGRRFGASAARFGYHGQLAHYEAGVKSALGWAPEEIAIIAVESHAPYDVGVFVVGDDTLHAGREEVRELLDRLAFQRKLNDWPGRYSEKQALQLPAWMFADEDDQDGTFGLKV